MHIAIMAAGALGGILGARLGAGGEQVSVIARGPHLEVIRKHGLKIESALGDVVLTPHIATDDPAEIGPVDVIIFTVKLWDTQSAAVACKPMLGEETIIVPFQNGVESAAILGNILGADRIMSGVAYISAAMTGPGEIRQNGEFANYLMGAPSGVAAPPMLDRFIEACKNANVNAMKVENIEAQLWKKLVFFAPFSGLMASARTDLGTIRDDEDLSRILAAAMEEAAAVAKARGIELEENVVQTHLENLKNMPAGMRATMAFDLDAGRKIEAYWLGGGVSRLGREAGVATPVNDTLYASVKPFASSMDVVG